MAGGIHAQAPLTLRFADATIRESAATANARPGGAFLPSGDFTAVRQTLRQLIAIANNVRDYQVIDGPDWIGTAHFDVAATAPEAASSIDGPGMLRLLLIERFALKLRDERRKIPAYVLETDGRRTPGRRLRKATAICTPLPGRTATATRESASGVNECTAAAGWSASTTFIRQSPLSTLARFLERDLSPPVVDRTGLTGKYDADVLIPAGASVGEIRGAVRDQLGLQLTQKTAEFRVINIQAAERP